MALKSTIDSIMSGAITCSFAIPEGGVAIAGALAAATSLFDILYSAAEEPKPEDQAVTVKQFQNAMTDMKAFVANEVQLDLENQDLRNRFSTGQTYMHALNGWLKYPERMTPEPRLPERMEGESKADYRKRKQDAFDAAYASWNDALKTFANPLMVDDCPFLEALQWVSMSPKNRVAHLDFYMFFINLYMNYAKLAMTWEYTIAQKKYAFEASLHASDVRANNLAQKIWKAKHPGQSYPVPTPPTFDQRRLGNDSKYIQQMMNEESGIVPFVKIARQAVNEAGKGWNKREKKLVAAMATYHMTKFKVPAKTVMNGLGRGTFHHEPGYTAYTWYSKLDGFNILNISFGKDIFTSKHAAQKSMHAAMSATKTRLFKKYGKKYFITGLTLDKIHKYDAIVKVWEATIKHIEDPSSPISTTAPETPAQRDQRTQGEIIHHTWNGHVFFGDG